MAQPVVGMIWKYIWNDGVITPAGHPFDWKILEWNKNGTSKSGLDQRTHLRYKSQILRDFPTQKSVSNVSAAYI
jgi:hypothetical protein